MNQSRVILGLTTAVAVLGGLSSWQALGWPRPLVKSDLAPITRSVGQAQATADAALELAESNNRRILQNDWWRYDRDIEEVREAIAEQPGERRLKDSLRRLRREQAEIQRAIDKLD